MFVLLLALALPAVAASADSQALLDAVRGKSVEKVQAQLAAGADVNQKTARGATALMLSLELKQPEIASLLIDKGASLTMKDDDGWNALIFALYYTAAHK